MSKRSFLFGTLALLAAMASATPSRAGSVLTTVQFTGATPALDTITITYTVTGTVVLSGPPTPSAIPGSPGGTVTFAGDVATLSFKSPGATSLAPFTFALTETGVGTVTGTATFTPPGSSLSGFGLKITSVPEPASIALLGIGMTGFLAFRRFFKKTSVA